MLERAVDKALQRLRRAPERAKDRLATVTAELTLLEVRMRHLVDEVARGYATDTLRVETSSTRCPLRSAATCSLCASPIRNDSAGSPRP
jgi:hypothetical protein